jgi:hypothetical protein
MDGMKTMVRRALGVGLAVMIAALGASFAGCSGDDPGATGAGGEGASGPGVGGGGMAGTGGTAGMGGIAGMGGAGGGMAGTLPSGPELNSANGSQSGATYSLDFQLGRSFHQRRASAGDTAFECAAPVQ